MKRSHAIMLGATGIILAGAWLGSGSGSDEAKDAAIYNDVDECICAGVLNGDTCREQFNQASYRHLETAPKFSSQAACEVEYGVAQCKQSTWNGASVFVPAMIGFLVANHLANNRQPQALMPPLRRATPCPPGQTPETMPGCYAPRQSSSSSSGSSYSGSSGWRSYSTSGGDTVSRRENAPGGVTKVPSSAAAAPVARGSLGAVAPRATGSTSRSSSFSGSSTSRGGFGSTGRSFSSSS
jgi:hypothetical protein